MVDFSNANRSDLYVGIRAQPKNQSERRPLRPFRARPAHRRTSQVRPEDQTSGAAASNPDRAPRAARRDRHPGRIAETALASISISASTARSRNYARRLAMIPEIPASSRPSIAAATVSLGRSTALGSPQLSSRFQSQRSHPHKLLLPQRLGAYPSRK